MRMYVAGVLGGVYNDVRATEHTGATYLCFVHICDFIRVPGRVQAQMIDITFGQGDNRLEGQANFEGYKSFHKADGHRSTH